MKHQRRPLLLLVLACVCLVYSNHFGNGFHFDDFHTIVDNPFIRTLHNIPRFFTDADTFSVLPANRTYRPVVSGSLAVDYWLGSGYHVLWFHVSTFLCFLLQLAAIYFLFNAILHAVNPDPRRRYVCLFATAWYGLHPAVAETVNYIIQRGDLYSTLGVIAGLLIYARFPVQRKTGGYLLPVAFGVLAKPPALVFPVLLFFYIFFFEENARAGPWKAALTRTVPSFLLCAFLAWLQADMTPKSYLPATISAYSYRITQPFVWLRYFGSFFLPIHLSADTDLQPFTAMGAKALAGFVFLGILLILIYRTARKPALRPISFGLLWFVVALLPTSAYALSEVENDHRLFFPFVGLVLAISWAGALCIERYGHRHNTPLGRAALSAACLCLLAGNAYGTWKRNQVWRTEESLWHDVTLKSPHNGRGLMNYGLTQMGKGDCSTALGYFRRAAEFTPNYPTLEINWALAHGCLGHALVAEQHFQRAVFLAPLDYQTHYYYGQWLTGRGQYPAALPQLNTAVQLNPAFMQARALLTATNANLGQWEEAKRIARETLRINPSDSAARQLLAYQPVQDSNYWVSVSLRQYQARQYSECIAAAQQALQVNPHSFEAYNNIGAAYGAMGQWDEAIAAARQALRLKPDYQLAKNNLAWAMQQKKHAGN